LAYFGHFGMMVLNRLSDLDMNFDIICGTLTL